jgi:hypothetical protein
MLQWIESCKQAAKLATSNQTEHIGFFEFCSIGLCSLWWMTSKRLLLCWKICERIFGKDVSASRQRENPQTTQNADTAAGVNGPCHVSGIFLGILYHIYIKASKLILACVMWAGFLCKRGKISGKNPFCKGEKPRCLAGEWLSFESKGRKFPLYATLRYATLRYSKLGYFTLLY